MTSQDTVEPNYNLLGRKGHRMIDRLLLFYLKWIINSAISTFRPVNAQI